MAAELLPVARIDEYAKPCEPAIHVLTSVAVQRHFVSAILFLRDWGRRDSGYPMTDDAITRGGI